MTRSRSSREASPPKKRFFKPRVPVVVSADFISQFNCEPVFGINSGRFLTLLPKLGVPVISVGTLRLVERELLVEALRARAIGDIALVEEPDADEQPETPDEVLAVLGRRRTR